VLRPDDFLKGQLVLFGWRAGKEFGGHLASVAIMGVIANRVKLGWGNWMEVIADIPAKSATIEQPEGTPQIWSAEFNRLLHEVESVYDSSGKDLSCGALYWFDSSKPVTNEWFKLKVLGDLDTHKRIAEMNSLVFLR
jgi:hypothetical protein